MIIIILICLEMNYLYIKYKIPIMKVREENL